MTSSRLDRLFILLETGSSAVTRSAAAKQLGEVQKLHPHELNTLLIRTAKYLKSNSWETRIAAAEAIRAIVSNVPQWDPHPNDDIPELELSQIVPSSIGRLRFTQFDIMKVLENSKSLMASEGTEFDMEEDKSGGDLKEKLAKQRQILNAKLGLTEAAKIGIDVSDLFSNEDLIIKMEPLNMSDTKKPLHEFITAVNDSLSCRERNRAKRKARQAVGKKSREMGEDNSTNEELDNRKRIKFEVKEEIMDFGSPPEAGESMDWPLEWFCDKMSQELFSSCWESRHGAATALREVIAVHGRGAGKSMNLTSKQMFNSHQIWLEDMAIRLICVLALDRFGDFVSDAVVAPVRETCAQTLSAVLKLMTTESCLEALKLLLQLLDYKEWEARHGGLLGLKYLLAVKEDINNLLLPQSFPHILNGLSDPVDDVGAVAASSLIPVAEKLVELVPTSVPLVVDKLWELLAEQDELAAACNSFMGLLASILNLSIAQALLPPQNLNNVVPKLWPFLSHSTSSVRKATLQTLHTLTEAPSKDISIPWSALLLQEALRYVFQRVLVEPLPDIREVAEKVWVNLVKNSGLVELLHAACPFITVWLVLSMQITSIPVDCALLIFASTHKKKSTIDGLHTYDNNIVVPKWYIGAAVSGALVMFNALPEKLTPIVKPLMEAIRREDNESLQKLAAANLAILVDQCRNRVPCPGDKILVNLCTFLKCDPDFTPVIVKEGTSDSSFKQENYLGILTLVKQQKNAEKVTFRRQNSLGRGPGRPPVSELPLEELLKEEDEVHKINRTQRRGASFALTAIASHFGKDLPEKLPKFWEFAIGDLVNRIDPSIFDPKTAYEKDGEAEKLVETLQVLEVTTTSFHPDLFPDLMSKSLDRLCLLLSHPYTAVRHLASRCLAIFAKIDSVKVMEMIVEKVLPKMESMDSDIVRQGAIEVIACIVEVLQYNIIPYVVLLIVPLLGRMSDQNKSVRLMGTSCFATLVQLMPLDGGVPEPPTFANSSLQEKRIKEREFLEQLLTPSCIPDYKIPVPIAAELRSYQQAGVNWLGFLNKYKLHGILCDDMGLGKTLQSICILASDHYFREEKYKNTKSPDCVPLPSLVICPPTLIGHWVYEVEKFLSKKYLKPLQYNGTPTEREKLRIKFKIYNLIVASYDIVRKDINFFSSMKWNYVILDEGHIIKNGKTRTSLAIKALIANHRLILSGTPIQNNVLELWSLFDFLMPGFLGTEKQFTARYSKPILTSNDPKCSSKDQEAGVLAMEALHRQVLPFLLRRMKEDVLDDLPPKITQDYYCELSPLQEQLYEDFSKSQAHQTLQDSLTTGSTGASLQGNTHIFQALRYLQNVCNHPKLVLNHSHPQYQNILKKLKQNQSELDDINHSAKLPALMQLLQDCGIGSSGSQASTQLVINQHRALVFCQLKAMLDIIENDLFKKHMPTVTYLRLDGSIASSLRHSVVQRFNNDPSIDVLLLTTQVGGLGLNLTGADTVIFVEHDWNPMKDLQAMDRAHRIGQRKVVNVYRLITRMTLEEKIMGLQKFKVQTANTVISGENSKLETMGTEQLLDLFSHKPSISGNLPNNSVTSSGGMKSILENLPDLWDHKQYDDEYDMSQFMAKLK
ncbi:TATA-binding protein-associated factor 172 isoform X2 [Harmonia axyridis]|uniref:TATA-binding protein-associated factor 172 isoform X2 n=1 Tax=Harmonia axyridis TaxID=115357 RepID=UPI001E2779B8|nr:TATA-binding protein-associated factor 172 isoform X2 [Harmonia axyridis]